MIAEGRWVPILVTWFGCGHSRLAPGTVGSLGAVPLHLLLRGLSPAGHAAAVVALSALGIWASGKYADALGEHDPQSAVIDEVAGTLIALGLVRHQGALAHAIALVLFRALDIIKPGPIDAAQRAKPEGLGIMLDDLIAGLAAGMATRWLTRRWAS
jgi:phosphatidylglycerophosphatase A